MKVLNKNRFMCYNIACIRIPIHAAIDTAQAYVIRSLERGI